MSHPCNRCEAPCDCDSPGSACGHLCLQLADDTTMKTDGGFAFPASIAEIHGRATNSAEFAQGGMSLRDYFAAQALIAYGSSPRVMDKAFDDWDECGGRRPICIADFLAGLAYEVADAMLAERDKPCHQKS